MLPVFKSSIDPAAPNKTQYQLEKKNNNFINSSLTLLHLHNLINCVKSIHHSIYKYKRREGKERDDKGR